MHPIFSHTYPNGLVLVAEPMAWLQSAAFTFLMPAGCVYDPADRGRTEQLRLRDGPPRRRPARQPPVRARPG